MPYSGTSRDRDVTTLSPDQRDRIRRSGRVARALEAAQRRAGERRVRNADKPEQASGASRRDKPPKP